MIATSSAGGIIHDERIIISVIIHIISGKNQISPVTVNFSPRTVEAALGIYLIGRERSRSFAYLVFTARDVGGGYSLSVSSSSVFMYSSIKAQPSGVVQPRKNTRTVFLNTWENVYFLNILGFFW